MLASRALLSMKPRMCSTSVWPPRSMSRSIDVAYCEFPAGEGLLPRPHKAIAGRVTVGGCDGGTTLKLVEEKLPAIGRADNLANIRPHQTGHRSSGREVNQLSPHPLNDVGDREGFDALRSSEQGCQRSHAFRHFARLLAKRERPPIVELADCAVRREC